MKIEIETSVGRFDSSNFSYMVRVFCDGEINNVHMANESNIGDVFFNSITGNIRGILKQDVRKKASHNPSSAKLSKYLSGLRNKRVQLQNELDKIFDEIDSVLEILRSEENE